jgi:hypothetical protein
MIPTYKDGKDGFVRSILINPKQLHHSSEPDFQ